MKKFLTVFMSLFIVMAITSCGGNGGAKAVYDKIENGETLTTEDYNVMLDYGTDCLDELSKALEDNDLDKVKSIEDKFPYFETFMNEIQKADNNDIDKEKASQFLTKALTLAFQMQAKGADFDF